MMGKLVLWITLAVAACVTMNTQVTDAQRPRPILVISAPSDGITWPEVMYFPDQQEQPRPGRIYGQAYYIPATRDDVNFVLFTRRGPVTGETLKLGDAEMLRRSTFNHLQPTKFLTHGFLSGITAGTVRDIKNMYLGFHEVNVIAVDWSRIAASMNYFVVKQQTIPVGGVVAEFVHFLAVWGGVDLGNVHLIGHSLGAHVMGIAGKAFKKMNRKVGRITGLDPAGPLFKLSDPSTRLDRDDGEFVDVIHTCGGWLGFLPPIGKVDFFPNGGAIGQPGCPMDREPSLAEEKIPTLKRWQLIQRMLHHYWRRWSREYLQSLQQRQKWTASTRNIKAGDLVIVRNDNTPPARWQLARVIKVHPGDDGHVRVVTIQSSNSVLKRPVNNLIILQ